MEYFLAFLALLSTATAVFGNPTRKEDVRAATVKILSILVAVATFIGSCFLNYEKDSDKDNARYLIKQGEGRAMKDFIAPISFFYSDYLGGLYIEKLDISKVFASGALDAMQNICFSDNPKNVKSIPPQTWGDEFGSHIRAGVAEIKETLALYQPYMTSHELQVMQNIERDSLIEFMLSNPDFSHEHDSRFVSGESCSGITPIGQYENYLHNILELQTMINNNGR